MPSSPPLPDWVRPKRSTASEPRRSPPTPEWRCAPFTAITPSKHHVFAAVLFAQVSKFRPPPPSGDPAGDIAALMVAACRNLLRHKHLAHAMITSTQIVRAQEDAPDDPTLRELILDIAGVENPPTAEHLRRTRLVQQAAFGILTWTVGGALRPPKMRWPTSTWPADYSSATCSDVVRLAGTEPVRISISPAMRNHAKGSLGSSTPAISATAGLT